MSRYHELSDEERIKMAKDAVKYKVPIAPALALWLREEGLYDQIVNPKRITHNEPTIEPVV